MAKTNLMEYPFPIAVVSRALEANYKISHLARKKCLITVIYRLIVELKMNDRTASVCQGVAQSLRS